MAQWEDAPTKSGGWEDAPSGASQIPTGGPSAPAATTPEESSFGRVLRKAGEAATAVGPVGVATGGALKLAGRAPQAVQQMAGPVARGGRALAEALTPTSLRQLVGMTGSAALAGGAGEVARQAAETGGAGKTGQQLAEMGGAMAPSAAAVAARRTAAPLVEAAGKRLYSVPPELRTPEKEAALRTAQESGMKVLPSQIKESRPLQMIERMMQLLPGSKEEFVKFGRQNQEAANKAVAKAFGGMEPSVASSAMQTAKTNLQNDYNTVLGGKEFTVDFKSASKLAKAFADNEELKNFALANAKVGKFAESLVTGQKIDGQLWKEVRSDISDYVSRLEGSSKLIGKNVLQGFDDIAQKNLGEKDYSVLRGVDRKYAALKSFEDAFSRDPSLRRGSDVDINKFARQYANVEPMNVLYGREGGRGGDFVPLSQMGEQYQIFSRPRIPQTEATTLGGLLRAGTGLSLFGGGLAAGVPYLPAAAATYSATPPVARRVAQAYLNPQETAARLRQSQISPYAGLAAAQVPVKE